MKFFLPDWDDRVDPGFDFRTERFTLIRDPYSDDQYGHEVYQDRLYDGILVSRMSLGETGPKRERVEKVGMRRYLRLTDDLELFGDCGAFGYIRENVPKFDPIELVDYYDLLGFDYGVSVDHIIVPAVHDKRHQRYELTLRNAEYFLNEHRRRNCQFVPVGAVQGWDRNSYVAAATALVDMGYDYIAVGGLARSNTHTIAEIIVAIVEAIPTRIRIHAFGVARTSLLLRFAELGITSVDSSAPLRQAWLSPRDNYYTPDRTYAAIRIPIAKQERPKAMTLVSRSPAKFSDLQAAELSALDALRAFDRGDKHLVPTIDAIMTYDQLLANRRDGQSVVDRRELYRETLRARPWKKCPCVVCRELGVEVIVFRGNNRNRRRGFHNVWVLRQRLARARKDLVQ